MKIHRIIWKERIVEKIENKHNVTIKEVEDVFSSNRKVYRINKGHVKGEDVYLALGKTGAGRYLSVFFIVKKDKSILPISARDMDTRERRRYRDGWQ